MKVFLRITIREKKCGTIICLKGHLTAATSRKSELLLNELITDESRSFALDLTHLTNMDGKGLNVISDFLNLLSKKDISLYAFGMNDEIYDILNLVDIGKGIKLLKNEKAFESAMKRSSGSIIYPTVIAHQKNVRKRLRRQDK